MRAIFITGIPTAGKSYLARMLAEQVGGVHVSTDQIREDDLAKDPRYEPWVNLYWNKNEQEYYTKTSHEEQWATLVEQSEALWPGILERIQSFTNETKPVIFEGVSILPHLAKRDLPFPGLALIGRSRGEVLTRLNDSHRWGETPELHQLEADAFFDGERPRYRSEAERYGYKVFETAEEALPTALELLR